jgi:hypothetical protein
MAENESLDLRLSRRWQTVMNGILRRQSAEQISKAMLKTFQQGWKNAQRQFQKYGTSLDDLLNLTQTSEYFRGRNAS